MNTKYLFTGIAIVALIAIGLFVYNQRNQSVRTSNVAQDSGAQNAKFEVVFDGKTFSPATLTVKQGDVVSFTNKSSSAFWPASAPHPTHTNYSAFDSKQSIEPGQSWQFAFTKVGTWSYHDHLNPAAQGKIIVQ